MLNNQQISTVKSTIPLLESVGPALTEHFYTRMFEHNPELKDIFNMSNQHTGRQQVALFQAIAAYAKNIENLQVLTSAVERIAQKHTSFYIQPDHYDIVGHHLIETLRELAKDVFTQEIEQAWKAAYAYLAGIFIARENELYTERADTEGGWQGKREFILVEKRIESEWVKTLVFEPADKGAVIGYEAGQYLGIDVKPSLSEHREIRQYSLSGTPNGKRYQISVKREIQGHAGLVSNFLHDELRLGDSVNLLAPCGDFFYTNKETPTVLISAGVGLTPMQSMIEQLFASNFQQPVLYLHACNNSNEHSFSERVSEIVSSDHGSTFRWKKHTWYGGETPVPKIASERQYFHHGFLDLSQVENELHINEADYYLCGPLVFMESAKQQLLSLGATDDRIHYEVFGPHEDL